MKKSSAISAVLKLKLLLSFSISAFGVLMLTAQKTEHYNSPLYSPKTYDPTQGATSNGLPKTLQEVGIEQKLNAQLPLDTEFKDENGKTVKLGEYFGKGQSGHSGACLLRMPDALQRSFERSDRIV